MLARVRRFYDVLSSGSETGTISQHGFNQYLKSFALPRELRQKWFTILDRTQDGYVDDMLCQKKKKKKIVVVVVGANPMIKTTHRTKQLWSL